MVAADAAPLLQLPSADKTLLPIRALTPSLAGTTAGKAAQQPAASSKPKKKKALAVFLFFPCPFAVPQHEFESPTLVQVGQRHRSS